jgi:aconitate hydratase 2 / 2-methylisocitrate dehydratase
LAAVASIMGKLPSRDEYMAYATQIDSMSADVYKYLNFDRMPDFTAAAEEGRAQMVELV